jgi:hypothetical protein
MSGKLVPLCHYQISTQTCSVPDKWRSHRFIMKFPPKLHHVKFLLVNYLKDETILQRLTLTQVLCGLLELQAPSSRKQSFEF